jgi:hypothetical protein
MNTPTHYRALKTLYLQTNSSTVVFYADKAYLRVPTTNGNLVLIDEAGDRHSLGAWAEHFEPVSPQPASVLVLVAQGKGESTDFITPKMFHTVEEANAFINKVTSIDRKYWTRAEIVEMGCQVEPAREGFYFSKVTF